MSLNSAKGDFKRDAQGFCARMNKVNLTFLPWKIVFKIIENTSIKSKKISIYELWNHFLQQRT